MKINRVNKRYPKSLKHTVNTSPDIVYNTLIINQKSSFKFSFDREIKNQFNVRKISKRGLE